MYGFEEIIKDHFDGKIDDVTKSKFIMLGDNLDTDIAFGKGAGITTALMLTGITRLTDPTDAQRIEKI